MTPSFPGDVPFLVSGLGKKRQIVCLDVSHFSNLKNPPFYSFGVALLSLLLSICLELKFPPGSQCVVAGILPIAFSKGIFSKCFGKKISREEDPLHFLT